MHDEALAVALVASVRKLLEELLIRPELADEVLDAWGDITLRPLVQAHGEERDRWIRGAGAARAEALRSILDGSLHDERLTSARLGYDLRREHQAFVVWAGPGLTELSEHDWFARMTGALEGLLTGTDEPFLVCGTGWSVTGCVSGHTDLRVALERCLGGPAGLAAAQAATGGIYSGLGGFRRSIAEAQRTRRVVRLLARTDITTSYAQVAPLDLLTRDVGAARTFTARSLGGLATTDAGARLLPTLRCFYEEGRSYARAGRRLGVHENTVAYRVRRAAELAGGDVESWALQTAVELAAILGVPETAPVWEVHEHWRW